MFQPGHKGKSWSVSSEDSQEKSSLPKECSKETGTVAVNTDKGGGVTRGE